MRRQLSRAMPMATKSSRIALKRTKFAMHRLSASPKAKRRLASKCAMARTNSSLATAMANLTQRIAVKPVATKSAANPNAVAKSLVARIPIRNAPMPIINAMAIRCIHAKMARSSKRIARQMARFAIRTQRSAMSPSAPMPIINAMAIRCIRVMALISCRKTVPLAG